MASTGSGIRCAQETSRGYGCLNQAKDGPFCPGHDPRNQCGAPTGKGRCKRKAPKGQTFCHIHCEGY